MASQPFDFFQQMRVGFGQILSQPSIDPEATTMAVAGRAFGWFESNIALHTQGLPELACARGCPTCCALRVTATAPEIFTMADYVRKVAATPQGAPLALAERIFDAGIRTRGMDENTRLASGIACPMLLEGICILHPVRTLACRGHAAYREEQCKAAARGEDVTVEISEPHFTLRALVQNALQAALRDKGLAWGLYELNEALALVLKEPERLEAWLAGEDSLAPAAVADLDIEALDRVFAALPAIT